MSLYCPLNDETRGLIGVDEIASMKDGSYIVNVARGGVVNEVALAEALRSKKLGGAAMDVLTEEPPKHGKQLLADDLRQYNLIVTGIRSCQKRNHKAARCCGKRDIRHLMIVAPLVSWVSEIGFADTTDFNADFMRQASLMLWI